MLAINKYLNVYSIMYRTENRLLRELLAVQNNRYDSTQTPKGKISHNNVLLSIFYAIYSSESFDYFFQD